MNIIEAVKLVQLDKNIKLKRRGNEFYEITLKPDGELYITSHLGLVRFRLTIEEILAEDWYVVKNEKLHTFEEALKAYKSGKKIKRKNNNYGIMYYDEYFSHNDCLFDIDDIMANDWIIIDKEVIR